MCEKFVAEVYSQLLFFSLKVIDQADGKWTVASYASTIKFHGKNKLVFVLTQKKILFLRGFISFRFIFISNNAVLP